LVAPALLFSAGCVSRVQLPPCHLYDGPERAANAVALLRTEPNPPLLIDGRPYVDDLAFLPQGAKLTALDTTARRFTGFKLGVDAQVRVRHCQWRRIAEGVSPHSE
jgi:hypothetical protein